MFSSPWFGTETGNQQMSESIKKLRVCVWVIFFAFIILVCYFCPGTREGEDLLVFEFLFLSPEN